MTQQHNEYRQSFYVDVITPGMVGQFYDQAPEDPWDGPWGRMEGTRLRIDYSRPILDDGTLGEYPDGPRDVVAIVQTEDSEGVVLNVKLPLLPAEGAVAIEAVELRRSDGQPVSRRALGRMGLGTVHKVLGRVLESPIAQVHLGERWTLEKPHPGRPGRSNLFYAQWAQRYVEALEAAPNKPIKYIKDTSDEYVTGHDVRARLRRARERGLLTSPARKGVPGGELTDKARQVLDGAGLLNGDER